MMPFTAIVPAHNEENIIGASLRTLLGRGAPVEVIVIANGCTDRTVEKARTVSSAVWVVDLAEASKVEALNTGLDLAMTYPIAFVDADVTVSGADLSKLAARLDADDRAQVASLNMRVEPSTSWWVRQYYRVWELTDYRSTGHTGSGLYMLSREGRARFHRFPDVIADDLFVQRLFRPEERLTASDLFFSVKAPGTLRALLKRNTRIAAGNRQLARHFPKLAPPRGGAGARALLGRVWWRPNRWVGFGVYATVYLMSHRRAQRLLDSREAISWSRDETTRHGVS